MPRIGTRYPNKLLELTETDKYPAKSIANLLGITERSVFRWHQQGYLRRQYNDDGKAFFSINPNLLPEGVERKEVKKLYTPKELEQIYTEVSKGERRVAIDVGRFVREKADTKTFQEILIVLQQFQEFVEYVIESKS